MEKVSSKTLTLEQDGLKLTLEKDGIISIIRLEGDIDATSYNLIDPAIRFLLERNRYLIVVDMAKVTYVSSAGWGCFVEHIKFIRDNGGDIKFAELSNELYRIFKVLEFDKIFEVYQSVKIARDSFFNLKSK